MMNNKLKIKIKKLDENAIVPAYANPGDAGMDIYATSKKVFDDYIEYGTGLSFEVPEGYVMLIFPRSSISNKDLILSNSVGVLDSGYRGELKFRFKRSFSPNPKHYNTGDRIGQIIIMPYPTIEFTEVDELSDSIRGERGFGSTGK